jgi:hypothetical protein
MTRTARTGGVALLILLGAASAFGQDFLNPTQWDVPSPAAENGRLFGVFAPSDTEFSNFVSPMTNPVFFEDPRTLTEARFIFLNHHLPSSLGGDNLQVIATQLRAALTENLSIIATKDGYIGSQSPLLDDGFADVAAGLKYNVYKNACSQTLISAGLTFELPVGTTRSLQGNGDGEFHLFMTGGKEFLPNWHWLSASGFRLPSNSSAENRLWYWSNHVDHKLGDSSLYLFTEANWYHYLTSADEFPVAVAGLDLFNLGAPGVAGNDIVTGAFGIKYKPRTNMELGIAYEIPYSHKRDILQDRLTVDFIVRF